MDWRALFKLSLELLFFEFASHVLRQIIYRHIPQTRQGGDGEGYQERVVVGDKNENNDRRNHYPGKIEHQLALDDETEVVAARCQVIGKGRPRHLQEVAGDILVRIDEDDRAEAVGEQAADPAEKIEESAELDQFFLADLV